MTREHSHEIEEMARAVQAVLLRHKVYLWQHDVWINDPRTGRPICYPATQTHKVAVGDTIITLGANPRDYGAWTRVNQPRVESEIAAEVARRLGLKGLMEKAIVAKTVTHNQIIRIEITRPNPQVYGWEEIAKYAKDGILLGRDQLRQPILMDFERGVPGYLVTGASRSGKTNFLRAVIAQAIHRGTEVYLAHLKPGGVRDYVDLIPFIKEMAHDEEGAERLLASIEKRVVLRNRMAESTETRILFIWDEASEPFTPPSMGIRLGALAKGAGSSNVFLLVGVQNATKEVHKDIRYNLVNRIAFRASKGMASHNTGLTNSGIESFAKGEALVITEGFTQRITTPRAEAGDIEGLLKKVALPIKETRKMETLGEVLEYFTPEYRRLMGWVFLFILRYGRAPSHTELRAIRKVRKEKGHFTNANYAKVLECVDEFLPLWNVVPQAPRAEPGEWVSKWG